MYQCSFLYAVYVFFVFFFFQAEDGIRDKLVTGVQTCALPILVTSLLAFNAGVELGQLVVLLITIPVLAVLFRFVVAERMGTILMSALVAHTAWHWALDRGNVLLGYRWPEFTLGDAAAFLRLLMVIVAAAGIVWLLNLWLKPNTSLSTTSDRAEAPSALPGGDRAS